MKQFIWVLLSSVWTFLAPAASTTNHFEVLKQSRWFAIAGGIAGTTTQEGHAVAAICQMTNGVAMFKRLLDEKGTAQKLYGLLGLHLLKAPEVKTVLPPLLASQDNVQVLRGCIAGEQEVGQVAREIKNDQWTLRFVPVSGAKYAPSVIER
jgi:hypothetical protein